MGILISVKTWIATAKGQGVKVMRMMRIRRKRLAVLRKRVGSTFALGILIVKTWIATYAKIQRRRMRM